MDGDGDADVLAAFAEEDEVRWYENAAGDGSTWIARSVTTSAAGATSACAADVDADGDLDLLSSSAGDDKVAWYRSDPLVEALEMTRLGSPPNPLAFLPGRTSPPILGATWDPLVEAFLPEAFLSFVAIDLGVPINVPTPIGTLLCSPPPMRQVHLGTPGQPFAIAVPSSPSLIGLTACSQGGAVAPGGTIALTNALDLVIGTE
jgi:hypothetical protein